MTPRRPSAFLRSAASRISAWTCSNTASAGAELESVAAAVGLDALCDKESKAYRESVIAYTQNRDSILAGLMEKPQLLRLPIVRDGRRATVGYCPEIWEEWLKG